MNGNPPRLPRMLLSWILPKGPVRDGVLGDLHEMYGERRTAGSRVRSAAWYWREAAAAALRYTAERFHRRTPSSLKPRNPLRSRAGHVETLLQDIRYALRMLRRAPAFTAVAVLTISLAVGANTAIFSVVNGVLLTPLPYPEPGRLVRVFENHQELPEFPLSPANFLDYRERNEVFDGLAVFMRYDLQLAASDRPERLTGMRVSHGFFRVLGFQPALGRAFRIEDELPGNQRVVILSDHIWRTRLDGNAQVVGTTVNLNGVSFTVIGVMPPGVQHVGGSFRSVPHGETVDCWWPLTLDPGNVPRRSHYFNGIGRLRSGVTVAAAQSSMDAVTRELRTELPDGDSEYYISLVPLQEEIVGHARPMLLVAWGAVGFVLLIACINVANFMLARGTERRREMAVREAIGADKSRLVRQTLTESFLLALMGGAIGVPLAVVSLEALARFGPDQVPRLDTIAVDGTVLIFTFAATALTGALFGLPAAFQIQRVSLMQAMKADAQGTGRHTRRFNPRSLLVVSEVSLAFVLLIGAGLLLRSFVELRRVDSGFRTRGVLTASVALPGARYSSGADITTFYRRLVQRLQTLPGVQSAGVTSDLPWTGFDEGSGFSIEGWDPPPNMVVGARYHWVSPGYLETMGIPLLAGRMLTSGDDADAPRIVLINRSMARLYWLQQGGAGNPIGARILYWGQMRTVVGIIGDVKDAPGYPEAPPAVYVPLAQRPRQAMSLAVRVDSDPSTLAASIRSTVAEIDAELAVSDLQTMREIADGVTLGDRFTTLLVGTFAALALILAAAGIYGVVSYTTGQQTREIAIRLAVGARTGNVVRLVVGRGLAPAATGLAVGVAGAFVLTRTLASMLYAVSPTDPTTFVFVSTLLLAVAFAACYLPALRASRVDPMGPIRQGWDG